MRDIIQQLVAGMGRSKATPLCPYVFHLYHMQEVLLPTTKKKEYRIAEALLKHNVEPEEEERLEASKDSERESLDSKEIQEIQRQKFQQLKKSPRGKRESLAAKDLVEKRKTPTIGDAAKDPYQTITTSLQEIWQWEQKQGELIRALCKKLGKVRPKELEAAIDNLPSRKRMDELEAKNSFLLDKGNKLKVELKQERKDHLKAIDKLNSALLFNQKLEAYVGNTGEVVNKARLFDENLAKHLVSAAKVIPVLVDFAEKMEELLDNMRVLFEGLQPDVPPIATENLPDISGEIPSLTEWGKERVPTETPTKSDQPSASGLTREKKLHPNESMHPQLEDDWQK